MERKVLANNLAQFTADDLAALVYTSGLNLEAFEQRQKRTAIHWLVNVQVGEDNLAQLAARAARLRPDLDWPSVPDDEEERPLSFQEQMPGNHCWGCGPTNEMGLGIKSYWDGDEGVCTFLPEPQYIAGPEHILNGGIMSTILDCHAIGTAVADAYHREKRPMGSAPLLWYATGSMNIAYLKPAPVQGSILLRARVVSITDRQSTVICEAFSQGTARAKAEIVAVRVPPLWFEQPPEN